MIKPLEIDIDIMLTGLTSDHATQLETLLKKTCNEYHYLFNDEFYQKEDGSNSNYVSYILPAVRRVYAEIFIKEKEIFKPKNEINEKCEQLFKLLFDLEDFLKYLSVKLKNNYDKLDDLEFLDSKAEILHLIVQNYVAGLLKRCRISNPTKEIRNIKLERDLKI
jgi:hypothetical protein